MAGNAGKGRPTKCTPEVQAIIRDGVALGMPVKYACDLANVDQSTFYRWMERAEKGEKPYSDFRELLKTAEAQFMQVHLANVAAAGETQWQASMTMLERRFPNDFSRMERRAHTGPDGKGPVEVKFVDVLGEGDWTTDPQAIGADETAEAHDNGDQAALGGTACVPEE